MIKNNYYICDIITYYAKLSKILNNLISNEILLENNIEITFTLP